VRPVRFHPEAALEAAAAAQWYEARQQVLGYAFLDELDHAIAPICDSPRLWPLWPGVRRDLAVRRCLLPRFPYALAYVIADGEVVILAAAHLSRRPRYWQCRAKN
jgi:plasmid stabilization system protein ParE